MSILLFTIEQQDSLWFGFLFPQRAVAAGEQDRTGSARPSAACQRRNPSLLLLELAARDGGER